MTKNDVFFAATLIEYTARETKNTRRKIAEILGVDGIAHQIEFADVNHCLPMAQASYELVETYHIEQGTTDTISTCLYKVPSATSIGKVYMRLAIRLSSSSDEWAQRLYDVFISPLSDLISDFNSAMYYTSTDELLYFYEKLTN